MLDYKEAKTEAASEAILNTRRLCSQSMYSLADTKLNEDVVVPLKNNMNLSVSL